MGRMAHCDIWRDASLAAHTCLPGISQHTGPESLSHILAYCTEMTVSVVVHYWVSGVLLCKLAISLPDDINLAHSFPVNHRYEFAVSYNGHWFICGGLLSLLQSSSREKFCIRNIKQYRMKSQRSYKWGFQMPQWFKTKEGVDGESAVWVDGACFVWSILAHFTCH